jgi:hypothetical protein
VTRLSLAAARARETRALRRQQCVERIFRLGPRPVFELIQQLARSLDDAEVDRLLVRFAALDPGILQALGGNRLPSLPIRLVGGNQQ